jgi:EmrB/QacA subfamily drug resistance transporter
MKEEKPEKKGFHPQQWLLLTTLIIGGFKGRLDGTIVNLALPKIISEFGITVAQASWVTTAYIIANAIFIPIFGKLGDLIGMKKLNAYGIIGFTITSIFAGLSFNLSSLVFMRVLQAITISVGYPIAFALIAYNFRDKQDRAQAMGIYTAIFAAAAVFGPLIGGPLIDNFSWRSVFYINIPIGILATYMALNYVEEPDKEIKGAKNFDIPGAVLLGVFLGTLVLVLDQGRDWGWTSTNSIVSYLITAGSFIWFLLIEMKAKEPIVDLRFFKIPTFTASIITSFISFMGMIGGIFLIPIFAQSYLGYSVTKSGYIFIPMAIGLMLASGIGARLARVVEARYLISFGMFISSLMMLSFSAIDIKWTFFDISWRLFVFAAGLGLGFASLSQAATSTVPLEEVGVASSVLMLARNVSGAFGTAIFATILQNSITSHLVNVQKYSVINDYTQANVSKFMGLMALKSNILAYSTVFKVSIFFMLAGSIAALFMKESKRDAEPQKEHTVMME